MAREPQPRPQQTATPLASPLQKRSQYLAQALAEMSKEPQRIAGYGDLGARLLAQAITQAASDKTDKALGAEAANADLARRRAIASGVGIEVPGEMQEVGNGRLGNPIAPILRAGRNLFGGGDAAQPAPAASNAAPMPPASQFNAPMAPVPPVENGGALPPVSMMGQEPPQAMAQDPRLGPAPAQPAAMPQQQAGPPPQLVQQVERLLAQGTPEAYAQAEAIVQDYQQREMILASLTPEQRANPDFVYAALNAPQELGGNIAKGFAPVTGAAGSSIITPNTGRRFDVPNYEVVNDTVFRTQGGNIGIAATAPPGYDDITQRRVADQSRPVAIPQGGAIASFDPNTGKTEIQVERAPAVDPARQERAEGAQDAAIDRSVRVRTAVADARPLVGRLSSGVLAGIIPFNQSQADLKAAIEPILASLSFAELQQMRADSPTGGALGNIAVRELDLLGATIASLSTEQSPQRLLAALDRVDGHMATIEAVTRADRGMPLTPDLARRLPPGTEFIGTDGVRRTVR